MDPIRRGRRSPTEYVQRQRRLASFLRTHLGVITTDELDDLGFNRRAVKALVQAHRLVRIHNGVYRDGTIPSSLRTDERAARLSIGEDSMLGLESSAYRGGLLMFPPSRPQIVVPSRKRVSDRAGVDIHRFPLVAPEDIRWVDGDRCTGPARTVLDLAAAVRSERQWRALRRAVRQSVKAEAGVGERLRADTAVGKSFPGSLLVRTILEQDLLGTPEFRSTLEEDFLDFCDARGIPRPQMNVTIEGLDVDAAWFKERVIVELDTWDYHGDELSFEKDRERDEFLRERGWPVSRVTGRRLAREPDIIDRQLRRRLGLPLRNGR